MILEILAIGAGAVAIGAWVRRRRKAREAARSAPVTPPPRVDGDIRVGDAILHLGDDFLVVSETRFEEEGPAFSIWTVESDGRTRFLLREADPARTTLWLASIDPPVPGRPPERHRQGDLDLRLRARGHAKATRQGAEGPVPQGEVEWARFAGPGRSAMMVFSTHEDSLWLFGEETLPGMLEVLPSS